LSCWSRPGGVKPGGATMQAANNHARKRKSECAAKSPKADSIGRMKPVRATAAAWGSASRSPRIDARSWRNAGGREPPGSGNDFHVDVAPLTSSSLIRAYALFSFIHLFVQRRPLLWLGLVFDNVASIFSPLTISDWHSGHTGTRENVKLSLIHRLQFSPEQSQTAVISAGTSSNGFFRE